mmetsp:Transcript_29231/g.42913  ORF Transcript_29231/g.42913 Transcript_29231/m.42913 type:complete len:179 (-) Transcript_29231:230-766(-)|eukprot:CAMPEP_0116029606 /NCGR_PEP_ID=MMETSP0321-20121206/16239_1 /TAXON_ID=163516 /ORGANISM="Leptocylindrus danicus var. danicus, Strain B650" /LENGTH=178 /DNA_ID=CAMNT_0003504013 /DNA_START=43 /DNA_END=579 /DNA_ORIENTATION=-
MWGFDAGYMDYHGCDRYIDGLGNPVYKRMADKSQAAIRRENTAKEKFNEARLEFEQSDGIKGMKARSTHRIELLQPSCHLTSACWSTFRKHVIKNDGWTAKRRAATEEEKKASGEKRKGKVYFIDVIYTAPSKSSSAAASKKNKAVPAEDESSSSSKKPAAAARKKAKLGDSTNSVQK